MFEQIRWMTVLRERVRLQEALAAKTDAEIADIVEKSLWPQADMNEPDGVLLSEVIERLHRAKGGPLDVGDECFPSCEKARGIGPCDCK